MALVQSWCSAYGRKEKHYHLAHYDPFQFFNQHIDARLWSGHLMYTASGHLPNHTWGRYCDSHSTQDQTRFHRGWAPCLQLSQPWLEISVTVPTPHTPVTKHGAVFLREVTCSDHLLRQLSLRDLSSPNTSIFHLMTTKNREYEKGMGK